MHVFYFLLKFKKRSKLDYLENVIVAIWFESNIQTNNHDMEIVFMGLCAISKGKLNPPERAWYAEIAGTKNFPQCEKVINSHGSSVVIFL